MTIELKMLACSVVLGMIQIFTATGVATKQRGIKWNLSSRGQEMPPLSDFAARLARASENFKETFPFFIAAVLVVQLTGSHNSETALGAQLYFWGRVIYWPLYAFNVPVARTLAWGAATTGIFFTLPNIF